MYSEIHPPTRSLQWIRDWNPTGIILSGGPNSVYEEGAPTADPGDLRHRADLGGLLRHAARGAAFWRRGDWCWSPGVRTVRAAGRGTAGAVRRLSAEREHDGLDEPRRSRRRSAARGTSITASSGSVPIAAMRHSEKPIHCVQFHPGSRAHAARRRAHFEFPLSRLPCAAELDAGRVRRERSREDSRAGRLVAGDLRPVRRRRLVGRRGARASRHRRPAHLRVRRHGPAAAARARAGGAHLQREPRHQARHRRRVAALSRCARGRRGSGAEANDHRPHVHRRVRGGDERSGEGRAISSCRARSIPT